MLSACVDGWFTLPFSVPNYLADHLNEALPAADSAPVQEALGRVNARTQALLDVKGTKGPTQFHRELGEILYRGCGVGRSKDGLIKAREEVRALRDEFWKNVSVPGVGSQVNQTLE